MKKLDVLIVGGGPGGIISASLTKKLYPHKSIAMIRKEELVLMPSGIPYIFGTLGSSNKDVAMHDAGMENDGVEIIIDEVVQINTALKTCYTKSGKEIQYDKLIFATGSIPVAPHIPGSTLENVFTVPKNKVYIDEMLSALAGLKHIVIVGGGTTGIELAEELRRTGKEISVIEQAPQLLASKLDDAISEAIADTLRSQGIALYLGVIAKEVAGDKKAREVLLSDGVTLSADAAIFCLGHVPNSALATQAGIILDDFGAIQVDRYMNTSVKDIFAIGDCASKKCFFSGQPIQAMLASIACTEARIVATNLYCTDRPVPPNGTVPVMMSKVGNIGFGSAGVIEKTAVQSKAVIKVSKATGIDKHPGSLPNIHNQFVKLIADANSGVIIGGEVMGGESIGELLNIIALAIQKKSTAYELFTMHIGTHPLLTSAPGHYIIVNAAEGLM